MAHHSPASTLRHLAVTSQVGGGPAAAERGRTVLRNWCM